MLAPASMAIRYVVSDREGLQVPLVFQGSLATHAYLSSCDAGHERCQAITSVLRRMCNEGIHGVLRD